MRRPLQGQALVVLVLAATAAPAAAHEGPPYAILVDHRTGPFRLSVWADPDVGTGTFIVYLEPSGSAPLPADCNVEIFVQPADRRIAEVGYRAAPQKIRGGPRRFHAEVRFDTQEHWRVRFRLASALGRADAETVVAVTPPGQGPVLDFALYLFPFVAVAFLFVKAALRRRPGAAAG